VGIILKILSKNFLLLP